MNHNLLKRKGLLFLIGFFSFCFHFLTAQDQRVADSLSIIYNKNHLEGEEKLKLLKDLAHNEMNDLKKGIDYANELIELSKQHQMYAAIKEL